MERTSRLAYRLTVIMLPTLLFVEVDPDCDDLFLLILDNITVNNANALVSVASVWLHVAEKTVFSYHSLLNPFLQRICVAQRNTFSITISV